MDEDTPQSEPEKPRFLLPDGCKDLIDALRLQEPQRQQAEDAELPEPYVFPTPPPPPTPLPASVTIPDPVILRDLASALHLKPFQLVSSLMELNVFVALTSELDFNTASKLCFRYGVAAIKVA